MLGYRGIGGDDRRRSQSHAVGPHRRDRSHHHRQRRGDGARHRPRETGGEEPADSRARARPPSSRSRRSRATPTTARCPATGISGMEGRLDVSDEPRTTSTRASRPSSDSGRSTSTSRPARSRTGRRRATRSPSSRRRAVRQNCVTRPTIGPATTGSAAARGAAAKRGVLTSAPFPVTHPYASFLVSGGAFRTTRVELVRVEDGQPLLHRLRFRLGQPAARGRGSPGAGEQGRSSFASWTTRPARRPRRT